MGSSSMIGRNNPRLDTDDDDEDGCERDVRRTFSMKRTIDLPSSSSSTTSNKKSREDGPSTNPHLTLMSPSSLLHQPIFVAISTNPLILVPCTYNSSGGLSIVDGSQAMSCLSSSAATPASVMMMSSKSPPMATTSSSPSSSHHLGCASSGLIDPCPPPSNSNNPDVTAHHHPTSRVVGRSSPSKSKILSRRIRSRRTPTPPSHPLDLSSHPKSNHHHHHHEEDDDDHRDIDDGRHEEESEVDIEERRQPVRPRRPSTPMIFPPGLSGLPKGGPFGPLPLPNHHSGHDGHDTTTDDNASRSSCCSPPPSLHLPGLSLGHINCGPPGPLEGAPTCGASMVKHGTYRCKDCDIVFYKQENYLVHKSLYCASRRRGSQVSVAGTSGPQVNGHHESSPSPEPPESDHAPTSSPEVTLDAKPSLPLKTLPSSSPGRSITSTPPIASPPPTTIPPGLVVPHHHQPVFCVSCGIRFTSLDTLHAHQTYYCIKRNSAVATAAAVAAAALLNGAAGKGDHHHHHHQAFGHLVGELNGSGDGHDEGSETKATSNGSTNNNSVSTTPAKNNHTSHNHNHNLQYYKCTVCGYKGHTMRGMRTHVRIHSDKIQGMAEDTFIEFLDQEHFLDHQLHHQPRPSSVSRGSRRRSHDPGSVSCPETNGTSTSSSSSKKRSRQITIPTSNHF